MYLAQVLIEKLVVLVAHAISGIYSTNLKYSKKQPLPFGVFGLFYRRRFGESNYCQNTAINTVLSVYEKKANDAGITVKIAARAGQNIPVSSQDLVIVIANLFENAINATKKLKSKDKVIDIDAC